VFRFLTEPSTQRGEAQFAKLKHGLRKAAARTYEGLCDAIADVLETCTPKECANYFRNSGYVQT
jgi:hypothetical protein